MTWRLLILKFWISSLLIRPRDEVRKRGKRQLSQFAWKDASSDKTRLIIIVTDCFPRICPARFKNCHRTRTHYTDRCVFRLSSRLLKNLRGGRRKSGNFQLRRGIFQIRVILQRFDVNSPGENSWNQRCRDASLK